MHDAATTVQAGQRRAVSRRNYNAVRAAAVRVQAAARGTLARATLAHRCAAATTIQSRVRGAAAAAAWRERRRCALHLQAAARRLGAQRALRQATGAICFIQAAARGLSARLGFYEALMSASRLQATVRATAGRRAHLAMRRGAIVVQAAARRRLATRRALALRIAAFRRRPSRCVVVLQRAQRARVLRRLSAKRHALEQACRQLATHHSSIPRAAEATAELTRLCSAPALRPLAVHLGALGALLRTLGSCNRSPHSLELLRAVLGALRLLLADPACRRQIPSYAPLAHTVIRLLINHWASDWHFEQLAACLLEAAHDRRCASHIQALTGEAAFARRSLAARLGKAAGAGPARRRALNNSVAALVS